MAIAAARIAIGCPPTARIHTTGASRDMRTRRRAIVSAAGIVCPAGIVADSTAEVSPGRMDAAAAKMPCCRMPTATPARVSAAAAAAMAATSAAMLGESRSRNRQRSPQYPRRQNEATTPDAHDSLRNPKPRPQGRRYIVNPKPISLNDYNAAWPLRCTATVSERPSAQQAASLRHAVWDSKNHELDRAVIRSAALH